MKVSTEGEPIIRDVEVYELQYLKQEVIDILNWYKQNPSAVIKK